jgi:hypothetical protein
MAEAITGLVAVLVALGAGSETRASQIDPSAMQRLAQMGAFLRAQKSMVVRAESTTDEVLDSGQKLQLSSSTELKVRHPDRLLADLTSDRKTRRFVYDGRTFTIYAPREHYYASIPAPATLQQLVELLVRRYKLELPLADLFYWGTDRSSAAEVLSAMAVGPSTVAGTPCDHYAFHQRDVDWQIWIQRGPQPLPRKMVITTTSEPSQPQHVVVMSWQLGPALDDHLFEFKPVKDAHRIELRPPAAAPRQARTASRSRP